MGDSVCLIVSVGAVLAWPSLQHDLSQYAPRCCSALTGGFYLHFGVCRGCLHLSIWTRTTRVDAAFIDNIFGGLAMVSAVLFTLWKLV